MVDPATGADATIIWLLAHFPQTEEATVRIGAAATLHRRTGLPIWIFGSRSAQFPDSVEAQFRARLVACGVPDEAIRCSVDLTDALTLATAQEAMNVASVAGTRGVTTLLCVSNRLQLLQVRGLLRRSPLRLVMAPVPLRDHRWWYVLGRLLLIPIAFLGVGPRFTPLVLLRRARASWSAWPF